MLISNKKASLKNRQNKGVKRGESVGRDDELVGVRSGLRVSRFPLIFAHSDAATTQNKPFFNTESRLTAEGRGSRHAGARIKILRKTKTHDVIPGGTIL